MRVNLHYFAGNIPCVNIVAMMDQVLTERRGEVCCPTSIPKSIFLYSCTGAEIEWVMGGCFLLVSKGGWGCMTSAGRVLARGLWMPHRAEQSSVTQRWHRRTLGPELTEHPALSAMQPQHGGLLAVPQNTRLAPEHRLKLFSDAVWSTIWWWAKVLWNVIRRLPSLAPVWKNREFTA